MNPDYQRRLLEALMRLEDRMHHDLDASTLEVLEEAINLLQKQLNEDNFVDDTPDRVLCLIGKLIQALPKYAALLNALLEK